MKIHRILPALAGVMLIAGADAYAQGPPPGNATGGEPGMHAQGRMGRRAPMGQMRARRAEIWSQLDLTDAQKTKIAEIRDRQQRKGIQARADLQVAALDLRKLMRADKPNLASINAQIDKMATMRASQRKAQIATLFEMRDVLTDEQRTKLKELRGPGGIGEEMGPGEDHMGPMMGFGEGDDETEAH
jgi:Spy/CpxP family protein refolding chaperone